MGKSRRDVHSIASTPNELEQVAVHGRLVMPWRLSQECMDNEHTKEYCRSMPVNKQANIELELELIGG